MSIRLFNKSGNELNLSLPGDRKPFWRAMSLFGWILVFLGVLSGVGFVVGLLYGVVFFALPLKGSHPLFLTFAFNTEPFWYSVFMLIDLAVAVSVGRAFVGWIKKRRNA